MKKILILVCFAAIIFAGCSSVKTISLSNYSGQQISVYNNSVAYYDGNRVMKCRLSDTATLNGYKCISWIWFFENGQIKQFETAVDIKMPNYTIPSNSVIFFNDQNPFKIKHIWFSSNVTINNIECRGGTKISTEFYDNDKLKQCFLANDAEIQGYSCRSSLLDPVYFYPDGKIKRLTLSVDSKFDNIEFKKGESIIIGENGLVSKFNR